MKFQAVDDFVDDFALGRKSETGEMSGRSRCVGKRLADATWICRSDAAGQERRDVQLLPDFEVGPDDERDFGVELQALNDHAAQHFLNFLPDPHGHGSLRPTLGPLRTNCSTGEK